MKRFAYKVPEALRPQRRFDFYATVQQPSIGLTAKIGNRPALIVGWDGQKHHLEGADGSKFHTENFVVSSEDIGDSVVQEHNATVAALRSPNSPLSKEAATINGIEVLIGPLEYDADTHRWTASVAALDDEDITEITDLAPFVIEPEFEVEASDGTKYANAFAQQLLDRYEAGRQRYDELPPEEQAAVDAFPHYIRAITDERVDGRQHPHIQRWLQMTEGV